LLAGGERLHLPPEALDARLERRRRPVARPEHERADEHDDRGDGEEHDRVHGAGASTSVMCWASSPQLSPPAHVSRFQMGTVRFRVSMPKRAAANASSRWGAETTTTTAHSPTARTPVRCSSAIRPTSGQRARASSAMAASRGTTWDSYASYSRRATPGRPGAWSRAVPENRTTAPQSRRTAQDTASATGRGDADRPSDVSPEGSVSSGAASVAAHAPQPGVAAPAPEARSATERSPLLSAACPAKTTPGRPSRGIVRRRTPPT